MSGYRWVSEDALLRALRSSLPSGAPPAPVLAVTRYLERQPRAPRLIGATTAARLLGILPPHMARLREQGRLPEPIEIEGSVAAYLREDIEKLADKLAAERLAREEKRAAREEETV